MPGCTESIFTINGLGFPQKLFRRPIRGVCLRGFHPSGKKQSPDCLWLSMIVYDCLWLFMIVYDLWLSMIYDCLWVSSEMIQPFFWSPVAMVPIPSHSIAMRWGARVLAMIIQGMIEALIRMERKVLADAGIFGIFGWGCHRWDQISMANPESSETEHLLSQKGNSMGNSQSEILMNVVNPMLWTILNGLCEMSYAGYAMVCPQWLVNGEWSSHESQFRGIGPASKGRGSTRWGKHRCTGEPQSPRKISSERWKRIEEVKKYAIFRNLRKGELNLTKPTLKWGWNGICIYINNIYQQHDILPPGWPILPKPRQSSHVPG